MPINYSLAMRGNPMDIEQPKKAYASPQASANYDLDQFCAHIAQHGSIWTPDIVSGVVKKMVLCLEELLVAGATVDLGELGSFRVGITSKGAKDFESFSVNTHIRKCPVVWRRGKVFKNLKESNLGVEFVRVLSKKEDAAAKKEVYGK